MSRKSDRKFIKYPKYSRREMELRIEVAELRDEVQGLRKAIERRWFIGIDPARDGPLVGTKSDRYPRPVIVDDDAVDLVWKSNVSVNQSMDIDHSWYFTLGQLKKAMMEPEESEGQSLSVDDYLRARAEKYLDKRVDPKKNEWQSSEVNFTVWRVTPVGTRVEPPPGEVDLDEVSLGVGGVCTLGEIDLGRVLAGYPLNSGQMDDYTRDILRRPAFRSREIPRDVTLITPVQFSYDWQNFFCYPHGRFSVTVFCSVGMSVGGFSVARANVWICTVGHHGYFAATGQYDVCNIYVSRVDSKGRSPRRSPDNYTKKFLQVPLAWPLNLHVFKRHPWNVLKIDGVAVLTGTTQDYPEGIPKAITRVLLKRRVRDPYTEAIAAMRLMVAAGKLLTTPEKLAGADPVFWYSSLEWNRFCGSDREVTSFSGGRAWRGGLRVDLRGSYESRSDRYDPGVAAGKGSWVEGRVPIWVPGSESDSDLGAGVERWEWRDGADSEVGSGTVSASGFSFDDPSIVDVSWRRDGGVVSSRQSIGKILAEQQERDSESLHVTTRITKGLRIEATTDWIMTSARPNRAGDLYVIVMKREPELKI